jgi:hypothetical protein
VDVLIANSERRTFPGAFKWQTRKGRDLRRFGGQLLPIGRVRVNVVKPQHQVDGTNASAAASGMFPCPWKALKSMVPATNRSIDVPVREGNAQHGRTFGVHVRRIDLQHIHEMPKSGRMPP